MTRRPLGARSAELCLPVSLETSSCPLARSPSPDLKGRGETRGRTRPDEHCIWDVALAAESGEPPTESFSPSRLGLVLGLSQSDASFDQLIYTQLCPTRPTTACGTYLRTTTSAGGRSHGAIRRRRAFGGLSRLVYALCSHYHYTGIRDATCPRIEPGTPRRVRNRDGSFRF